MTGKSEILQINYGEIDKQTIISLARTIPVAAVFKISKKLYSYSTPFVNIRWGAKKESQVHPYEAQIPMATMRKCGTKTENKFYDFILSKESQELHRKIQKSRGTGNTVSVAQSNTPTLKKTKVKNN